MEAVTRVRALAVAFATAVVLVGALVGVGALPAAATPPWQATPGATEAPVTWGVVPSGPGGPDGRSAFEYTVDPGTVITDAVAVVNYTQRPLRVDVYANDAITSTDGGFDLLPAAEQPAGVGAWTEIADATITIPAQSRADVPFTITVPEDATPGDHAGGVVASLTIDAAASDGRVGVEHRVGARIYLRVRGALDPQLIPQDVEAAFAAPPLGTPGEVRIDYTVRNDGNLRLVGRPTLRVSGPFGLARRELTADPLPELLPGDSVTRSAAVPAAWPLGRLNVNVEVRPQSSGGQALDPLPRPGAASTHVWAVPWIALAAVALLAVWLVRRRRRRRSGQDLEAKTSEDTSKEKT